MNSKTVGLLALAVGTVAGFLVGWRCTKKVYEQAANDEIDEMRAFFQKKQEALRRKSAELSAERAAEARKKDDVRHYADILRASRYTDKQAEDPVSQEGHPESESVGAPYVISPEEFGEKDGYETVSLNYYADGVLTDDDDEIIDDVDTIVGSESLTHFGEYEEDSVFVRNDAHRCDYEILKDLRRYSDVDRPRWKH